VIDRDRQQQLLDRFDVSDDGLPDTLCREVADLLGVADVTLALIGGSNRRLTLCASSANALSLDKWQFTLDEGPCLEAAAGGQTVSGSTSSSRETPWPLLAARAFELGYHTIAGTPMAVSGRVFGVMSLQMNARDFGDHTLDDAEEVASHLAGPIVGQLAEQAPWLIDLSHHASVHQATGMIAAQMGIGVDDALAVLRAHAWTEGRLLVHIAGEVVSHQLTFGTSADWGE